MLAKAGLPTLARLARWLVGWLVGWLAGWLVGWLVGSPRSFIAELSKYLTCGDRDPTEEVRVGGIRVVVVVVGGGGTPNAKLSPPQGSRRDQEERGGAGPSS